MYSYFIQRINLLCRAAAKFNRTESIMSYNYHYKRVHPHFMDELAEFDQNINALIDFFVNVVNLAR